MRRRRPLTASREKRPSPALWASSPRNAGRGRSKNIAHPLLPAMRGEEEASASPFSFSPRRGEMKKQSHHLSPSPRTAGRRWRAAPDEGPRLAVYSAARSVSREKRPSPALWASSPRNAGRGRSKNIARPLLPAMRGEGGAQRRMRGRGCDAFGRNAALREKRPSPALWAFSPRNAGRGRSKYIARPLPPHCGEKVARSAG